MSNVIAPLIARTRRSFVRAVGPAPRRFGTENCRIAIAGARSIAERLGHGAVGREHLLHGALGVVPPRVERSLAAFGVDLALLRSICATWLERADLGGAGEGKAEFTPLAKSALEAGLRRARVTHGGAVTAEDLLLVLLTDERSIVTEWLPWSGAAPERLATLREALIAL